MYAKHAPLNATRQNSIYSYLNIWVKMLFNELLTHGNLYTAPEIFKLYEKLAR